MIVKSFASLAQPVAQRILIAGMAVCMGAFAAQPAAGTTSTTAPSTPPAMLTYVTPPGRSQPEAIWEGLADVQAASPEAGRSAVNAAQVTGGPDEFGYAWDDSVPFTWLDAASSGVNTGLNGAYQATGAINLPFSFKYYQNAYNAVYVTTHGMLGFSNTNLAGAGQQLKTPLSVAPNNVIAPYWAPLDASTGGVYTLSGGSAPNRWFVVEWHQVRDTEADSRLSFEVVLWESGDIEFRYQSMNYGSAGRRYSFSAGMEDASGTVGLQYLTGATAISNSTAVRFTRPIPAARANLLPKLAGAFGTPGATVSFSQVIENFGDTGQDTFDLLPASAWPVTLFADGGVTPLTDTDGSGAVDTGALAQGSSRKIVIKVSVPSSATQGQSNNGHLLVRSTLDSTRVKTLPLRVAVPAGLVQDFATPDSRYDSSWLPMTGIYRPASLKQLSAGANNLCGAAPCSISEPVVAVLPNGAILHVFTAGVVAWDGAIMHMNATQIEATLMDTYGNTTPGLNSVRLTDNRVATKSLSDTLITQDYAPSLAAAPNGRIAVAWFRQVLNVNTGDRLLNVYYMVLDANLSVVVPPTNLTNNTQWAYVTVPEGPDGANRYYRTTAAATAGNRFFIGWQNLNALNIGPTAWYTVRDTTGATVRAVSPFGTDTCGYAPNFEPLADGNVFASQARSCGSSSAVRANGDIWIARLDATGNVLGDIAQLTNAQTDGAPDAVQLAGGNILVAWHHYSNTLHNIRYTVFNTAMEPVKAITDLPATSPDGDAFVSVTRASNQALAVLTWGEFGWTYRKPSSSLYAALLDTSGNVVLSPMVFLTGKGYSLRLAANGQANAPLPPDTTPPSNPASFGGSHAPGVWSNDDTVDLTWASAVDEDSGVDGYAIEWNRSATAVLIPVKQLEQDTTHSTSPAMGEGSFYFHLRTADNAGNWSPVVNVGPFLVDRTPPTNTVALFSSSHPAGAWSTDNTVDVAWAGGTDDASGIGGYSLLWDQAPTTLPDNVKDVGAGAGMTTSAALADGLWYFHVRVADNAGNWADTAAHLGPFRIDRMPPSGPLTLFSSSHMTGEWSADSSVDVAWVGVADAGIGVDGYSVVWDQLPTTMPDMVKDVEQDANGITSPALGDGAWYFHIRAVDSLGQWSPVAKHLGPFRIDVSGPRSSAWAPAVATGPFTVVWGGIDAGAGLANFDVWVRDSAIGQWALWLTGVTTTNALYPGVVGHSYTFVSQARDVLGNVEVDVPPGGDAFTVVSYFMLTGRVTNNRGEPVFNATITSDPPAMNTARTNTQGNYALGLNATGAYTLTVRHNGYGMLPPLANISVQGSLHDQDIVLLPLQNRVVNGGFEQGNLTGWTVEAGIQASVQVTAAHSGAYGLRLARTQMARTQSPQAEACATQTVSVPSAWIRPTASWRRRPADGATAQLLSVKVADEVVADTHGTALAPSDWSHHWVDLTPLRGRSVVLKFCLNDGAGAVYVDEVSVGDSIPTRLLFMPLVSR